MQELLELKSEFQLDFSLQSDDLFRRNKRLIFLDADMTFIQCEMINDMSRLAGKETEIAEITNRAMDGEINFKEALRQVVALLEGVRLSDLERLILSISYTPRSRTSGLYSQNTRLSNWNCERRIYQNFRSYKTAFRR